ncbi:BQ5605_C013g07207 [Microbotryum silenes-dioicae]|uniref:BQ5605_C013g07207 protein n=1 Tax=Microbotryum silenes-dioicae TaxID=796604 RepID=A0A2X0NU33_9BASI|nr:BQ5605_C013g07207 [Microbotryum silenes-dioicae]
MRIDSGGFQPGPVPRQAACRADDERVPYLNRPCPSLEPTASLVDLVHPPAPADDGRHGHVNPFHPGHVSPALSPSLSAGLALPSSTTSISDLASIPSLNLSDATHEQCRRNETISPPHPVTPTVPQQEQLNKFRHEELLAKAFMMGQSRALQFRVILGLILACLSSTAVSDFLNMPLDSSYSPPPALSLNLPAIDASSFETSPSASTDTTAALAALMGNLPSMNQGIISFDRLLDSPLGLENSTFSEFSCSPLFDDFAAGELPPPLDYSLFAPLKTLVAPPPTPTAQSGTASLPTPRSSSLRPLAPAVEPAAVASPAVASSSNSPGVKPAPNGFRKTQMLDLAAPVQARTVLLPSKTTRKRKTTAAEREIVKRIASGEIEPTFESLATPSDLPEEVVAAVEKKRLQNTISARKSRMRKMERVQELETENEQLKEQNRQLVDRIASLEASG